tara:strand:+ start:397 stop:699 length:303 start_codon:yes stop_codon:yes gene_type:complete
MNNKKTWEIWFKDNRKGLLNRFCNFIIEHKVGDMDLDTYCKYQYFIYLNEKKLVRDYKKELSVRGNKLSDEFPSEEHFRMSLFASVEQYDEFSDTEKGIA